MAKLATTNKTPNCHQTLFLAEGGVWGQDQHVGATTVISQHDIDVSAVLQQIHEHQIAVLAQILCNT